MTMTPASAKSRRLKARAAIQDKAFMIAPSGLRRGPVPV
jgi:hypothetical protein